MKKTVRNARRTNWESFKAKLVVLRRNKSGKVHNFMQIKESVNELEKDLTRAFEDSCPLLKIENSKSNP